MILSGHQPVYMPGIIFFNKMALSDMFMYVGHLQFSPKSWQQRNRIFLNGKEHLLSVPVLKADRFGQKIDEVNLDEAPWKKKHLGSIKQAYIKRPYFNKYYPELESVLSKKYESLGSLNRAIIKLIMGWLEINTPIVESYDYPQIKGSKTEMLIQMCQSVGATHYLSNEGSRVYVNEQMMATFGIQHCWQNFTHPNYEQGHPFLPNLSALDIIFNLGPHAGLIVKSAGSIDINFEGV
jgi:hypothetical protein